MGSSFQSSNDDFAAFDEFASIFEFGAVNNDKDRSTAHRIRYQIYCVENPFEDPAQFPDGEERDHLDYRSLHGLVRHRQSGLACGTVRLILPAGDAAEPPASFYELCTVPHGVPQGTTAEVSRFATSKIFRQQCESFSDCRALMAEAPLLPYMTASLIAFTIQEALRGGFTHLCAVMKPPLMRLLSRFGVNFEPIGPLVTYHGRRQPCAVSMETLLADVREAQPRLWEIATDSGALLETPGEVRVA